MTVPDSHAALEQFVDTAGAAAATAALAAIAHAKADHLDEVWQDGGLAGLWRAAGAQLDTVAASRPLRHLAQVEGRVAPDPAPAPAALLDRRVADALQTIGSITEHEGGDLALEDALLNLARFVRHRRMAAYHRQAGHVIRAIELEAANEHIYAALPQEAQW